LANALVSHKFKLANMASRYMKHHPIWKTWNPINLNNFKLANASVSHTFKLENVRYACLPINNEYNEEYHCLPPM
jgi:hypothetical protein